MPGEFQAIGESSFDQVLTKRLVGPGGALAPSVAPELFPVITLESDRPEWHYLFGGRLCAAWFDNTAVAGETANIRLRNPVNSGCLAVIELLDFLVSPASSVRIVRSIDNNDFVTAAVPTSQRDFRYVEDGLSPASTAQVVCSFGSILAGGYLNPRVVYNLPSLGAGARTELRVPFILPPGSVFNLQTVAVAARLAGSITWRERYINPTEK